MRDETTMKPLEAKKMAEDSIKLLSANQPLTPYLCCWLVGALRQCINAPHKARLDSLLGLRSNKGGILHAGSQLPARDAALKRLATERQLSAKALLAQIQAHRNGCPDAALSAIEALHKLPTSQKQLARILKGQTVAGQLK